MIDLPIYILIASGMLIGVGLALLGIAAVLWLVIKFSED
jgi:hypothetical protein